MAVLGMIAYVAARVGFDFSAEEAALWFIPLCAAIFAQGVADIGKPAAIVKAAAQKDFAAKLDSTYALGKVEGTRP